jgi:hypothetical protein
MKKFLVVRQSKADVELKPPLYKNLPILKVYDTKDEAQKYTEDLKNMLTPEEKKEFKTKFKIAAIGINDYLQIM